MYAILVNEPGGTTPSFVLATGAGSLEAAQLLMSSRAEEYISEQLELGVDGAEDYTIEQHSSTVLVKRPTDPDELALISFEATAITEIV